MAAQVVVRNLRKQFPKVLAVAGVDLEVRAGEVFGLLGPTGATRIDRLVHDLVDTSADSDDIVQSAEVGEAMLSLRSFMFERVYLGAEARSEHERVHRTLRGLFDHYSAHPDEVPDSAGGGDEVQRIADYIAGMTDRFCIATFRRLARPEESKL